MSEQTKENKQTKRQYSRIPIKKRILLVKEVLKRGKPLNQIIQQLNIKITTARFILNKYQESGAFPRRKFRKTPHTTKKCVVKEENQEKEAVSGQENWEKGRETQIGSRDEEMLKQEEQGGIPFYLCWYYYPLGHLGQ